MRSLEELLRLQAEKLPVDLHLWIQLGFNLGDDLAWEPTAPVGVWNLPAKRVERVSHVLAIREMVEDQRFDLERQRGTWGSQMLDRELQQRAPFPGLSLHGLSLHGLPRTSFDALAEKLTDGRDVQGIPDGEHVLGDEHAARTVVHAVVLPQAEELRHEVVSAVFLEHFVLVPVVLGIHPHDIVVDADVSAQLERILLPPDSQHAKEELEMLFCARADPLLDASPAIGVDEVAVRLLVLVHRIDEVGGVDLLLQRVHPFLEVVQLRKINANGVSLPRRV